MVMCSISAICSKESFCHVIVQQNPHFQIIMTMGSAGDHFYQKISN